MRPTRVLVIVTALATLLVGCGDDATTTAASSTVTPVADTNDAEDERIGEWLRTTIDMAYLDDAQVGCIAAGMRDRLDANELEQLLSHDGSTVVPGDEALARRAVQAMRPCVSTRVMMIESLIVEGNSIDAARCVTDTFSDDDLEFLMDIATNEHGWLDQDEAGTLDPEIERRGIELNLAMLDAYAVCDIKPIEFG